MSTDDKLLTYAIAIIALAVLGVIAMLVTPQSPPVEVVIEPSVDNLVSVGVLPFGDIETVSNFSGTGFETAIRDMLEAELPNYPGLKTFSRGQLDKILQEQNLYFEGLIDPTLAIRIGQVVPIQVLITGRILGVFSEITERTYESCKFDEKQQANICTPYTNVNREMRIQMTVQAIDTKTGEILMGSTFKEAADKTVSKGDQLPDAIELGLNALSSVAGQIASQISQNYTKSFSFGLYKGIKTKGKGVEGVNLAEIFTPKDTIFLLMKLDRMNKGDHIEFTWYTPTNLLGGYYDVDWLGGSEYIYYGLPLAALPYFGMWRVEIAINGQTVATDTFYVQVKAAFVPSSFTPAA